MILGRRRLPKSFLVLETDAFDAVLDEDFFEENPEIRYLGLQSPRHLLVRTDDGEWEKVHLEETAEIVEGVKVLRDISFDLDTEVKVEGLLRLEKEMLLTLETYTLATEMKLHAYEELNIEGDPCGDDFIELFANHVDADSELYCWRQGNSAWWYDWRDLGRWKYLYANPPFSQMEKVLTKVALEGARVILVVPEEGKWMKKAWRELLTKLTITQVRLPDVPMYKVDYGVELLPAPKWRTNVCLVDGSLNPVAREDLNPEVVEKITKNNRGWGRKHMLQHFPDLKESQQDRKREDMKVTIKELPKGNRELPAEEKSELSEEVHDSDGLSEAPSISTITPVTEGSYPTSMEYEDLFNDVLLACENEELLLRRTIEENLQPKSEWHGFQYGFETKKRKTKEAFAKMDVQLDLFAKATPSKSTEWKVTDLLPEYPILKTLKEGRSFVDDGGVQWARTASHLYREEVICVPSTHVKSMGRWAHKTNGHPGVERTRWFFEKHFYTTVSQERLNEVLREVCTECSCWKAKQSTSADQGLTAHLPIPRMVNSVLYLDFTEMPKYSGHDFALLVTCGLSRYTRVFPLTKRCDGETVLKELFEG